jgi:hypothetical protein
VILYLEKQLEDAYRIYRLNQVKKDMSFMKLEDFRVMFEDIMEVVYSSEYSEEENERGP